MRRVEGERLTKLPTESQDIQGIEGPEYKTGPYCAAPGCYKIAEHAHHIVRRSFLTGDFKWVRMPDGVEIGNLVGLCVPHHQQITDNITEIQYEDGSFYWVEADPSGWTGKGVPNTAFATEDLLVRKPLATQPPTKGVVVEEHEHTYTEERPICPGCGRMMPKPKIETPSEDKKPRGTWAVSVPADERENGAEVLDELLNAARDELDKAGISYGKGNRVKYYQLSTALALFVQHAEQVLSDD
jgi:hypothetical protein